MNNKLTVTIGIAAYNAEDNIVNLLTSLSNQKQSGFKLEKIIVNSDKSQDKTVKFSKMMSKALSGSNKIVIRDSKIRLGFASSLIKIIDLSQSDITIILNDDISIKSNNLINSIVKTFQKDKKIGMVCGNPQPLEPINFTEKAIVSTFNAYQNLKLDIKGGDSQYSCDGKVIALSKDFKNQLSIPKNKKLMGNVDTYLYFSCLKAGFKFKFCREAVVYYRNPTTIADYIKWSSRNNSNYFLLKKQFGEFVDQEYKKPLARLLFYTAKEFIKNPLGCIFIFAVGLYAKNKASKQSFESKWPVVLTTKNL